MTDVVSLRGVFKSYRRGAETVHALDGIDLEVRAGEVTALLGPSGSGKSTLLAVLAGWEQPDRGTVEGIDPTPAWTDLAVAPQSIGLLQELTIAENVGLPVRLGGGGSAGSGAGSEVGRWLHVLGLEALGGRLPAEVSMGEQQRAGLGRALVVGPRILLADEPSSHQDKAWAQTVWQAFAAAASEGTACLIATHDAEALHFADRVVRLSDGRVVADEPGPAGSPTAR